MTQWKRVPGYENKYEISSDGDILCLQPRRIVRRTKRPFGYVVQLNQRGVYKQFLVHRLVLMTFNPIPNCKAFQARCKSGDIYDTRLENWTWDKVGGHRTLTSQQVKEIRTRLTENARLTYRELAEDYGVSIAAIGSIMSGRNWRWLK